MEFCLMTEPQLGGSYDHLLEAARWCERNGLVGLARSDHYYWSHDDPAEATDAFATLAGLARDTESIRLCVLVTPITFRHPAVIAKTAATIDQMSGGRLDIGIGTGWNELEHEAFGIPFPERSERFDRLVETLEYLSAAFAEGRGKYGGRHYRLDADVRPNPSHLGLIVGGSGRRKTPTLAGRHADEYNTFFTTPGEAAPRIAVMHQAAARAGRDPDTIRVSMMGQVFGAPSESEYRDLMVRTARERDLTVSELEDEFDDQGVPHGTPDRLGETLSALVAQGVERIYLQHFALDDLEPLESVWAALSAAAIG